MFTDWAWRGALLRGGWRGCGLLLVKFLRDEEAAENGRDE